MDPRPTAARAATARMAGLAVLLAAVLAPAPAAANGAYTHIHVSQVAVELLPDGALKDLLRVPANVAALEAGSMFPDSGYAINDGYGELAHWPEFQDGYLDFLRERWQDDYSDPEAQRQVAFLLGDLSHGLADQVYDYTLLDRALEVDGESETSADELGDYFLVVDHDVLLDTQAWGAWDDLAAVFQGPLGYAVSADTLDRGMRAMQTVIYIQRVAGRPRYLEAWNTYPFLGTHVYNPAAPGSVPTLALYVAAHWEVAWRRLHGTASMDTDLVTTTLPPADAVNFPVDATSDGDAYRRIGLLFGWGIRRDQVAPLLSLRDEFATPVAVRVRSPYGGQVRNYLMLEPLEPLAHDRRYVVEVAAGVQNLAGEATTVPYTFSFRTRCAPDHLADCPPLAEPLVTGEIPTELPPLPGPDVVEPDAGGADTVDAGGGEDAADAGGDGGGAPDAGPGADAAPAEDAGPGGDAADAPDGARADAGDGAPPDGAGPDAAGGVDLPPDRSAAPDGPPAADVVADVRGASGGGGGGGGCAAAPTTGAAPAGAALLALLLLFLSARRRGGHGPAVSARA